MVVLEEAAQLLGLEEVEGAVLKPFERPDFEMEIQIALDSEQMDKVQMMSLETGSYTSVLQLMVLIQEAFGLSEQPKELALNGVVKMEGSAVLWDYGVDEESVIVVMN